jgi:hypothetical protein
LRCFRRSWRQDATGTSARFAAPFKTTILIATQPIKTWTSGLFGLKIVLQGLCKAPKKSWRDQMLRQRPAADHGAGGAAGAVARRAAAFNHSSFNSYQASNNLDMKPV